MMFCEIYVFSSTPTAEERDEAIAYLMKKWGIGGQSFAAPSVGSISAAAGAKVKLGTTVAAASLSGAGTVEAPCITNVTAIACTVTFGGGRPKAGRYPVLRATSFSGDVAETLASWTLTPVNVTREFESRFVVRDGVMFLEVIPNGMMLIIQ